MKLANTIFTIIILTGILLILSYLFPNPSTYTYQTSENKTEKLTDKQLLEKIGQMLIVGFQGTEISENSPIVKELKDVNIGGIILFDYDVPSGTPLRNIINPEQVKQLVIDLQKYATTPLLIAVDAEGDYVNRLKVKYGFAEIPSAQEMGTGTTENTKQVAINLTNQIVALGLNTNFAPVVDVNINPDNPVIGEIERSFSEDPEKVTQYALAFIEGAHQNNIITAIKHFPGHGSSQDDSHKGMADVTDTYQEEELIPYRELIKADKVDMVMTAHIMNRNIDPDYPATLSQFFIKDILRKDFGFEGVVVSDDMQMGAITEYFGFAESIILAINAGCDMLIISNNSSTYDETAPHQAQEIIFKAVKDGLINVEQIVEASNRITNLKKKFNIIK